MSAPQRRKTVSVDVGGVKVGGPPADRRPVHDQHRHRRRGRHGGPGPRAPRGGQRAGARHREQRGGRARRARHRARRSTCPVIGDFHYNGHVLLTKYPACARALAKYRINPGNVGGKHHDENFRAIVQVAHRQRQAGAHRRQLGQPRPAAPHRDDGRQRAPRGAARRARRHHERHGGERHPLGRAGRGDRARRTTASSSPPRSRACRTWWTCTASSRPRSDYPLHLGPHRGGHGHQGHRGQHRGARRSCSRRASATRSASRSRRSPDGDRTEEVQVAQQILQSLGLRQLHCPR